MNDELAALVTGVLADLDGAGALADWLQEHGREREAALLRRRWKSWKTVRAQCVPDKAFRAKFEEAIYPIQQAAEGVAA